MINSVVVLYNPIYKDLEKNIKSFGKNVKTIFLIDNSEISKIEEINKIKKIYSNIHYIWLGKNKGIAVALNLAAKLSLRQGVKWLLTMDQDSYFEDQHFKKFLGIFGEYEDKDKVGIFSPYHKFKPELNKEVYKYLKVDKVMTSGNLLNLEVYNKVGKFKEEFFIDEIDHEYCKRLINNNFEIILCNEIILNHKLGNLKKVKKNKYITEHNYVRIYYIIRNKLYMAKNYLDLKKEYKKQIKNDILRILKYEDEKILKLKMCWLAYRDFKASKMGKIPNEYLK